MIMHEKKKVTRNKLNQVWIDFEDNWISFQTSVDGLSQITFQRHEITSESQKWYGGIT